MDLSHHALVVVDAQQGFDDPWWGPRNNPACDDNVAALAATWTRLGAARRTRPPRFADPDSPLHPDRPGNRLKPYLTDEPALLVTKQGQLRLPRRPGPACPGWQAQAGSPARGRAASPQTTAPRPLPASAATWATTCCFVLDATHTFDRTGPDGTYAHLRTSWPIATATNLHGEFATVVSTGDLLGS